ncbi:3-oxoacyl-(acyl carrier protein) synthase 2 [Desulfovibrionales bacterium]
MIGNRVVVTGVAAITPIGNDAATSWNNLVAGVSGIGPITRFDTSEHATKIAGQVNDFKAKNFLPAKAIKRMELFAQYAVACGHMLLADADYHITPEAAPYTGCILGCGLGGLECICRTHAKLVDVGPQRVSPFFIPVVIANMAPGQISIATGAMGPNLATASACASGLHGIGYAYSEIKLGRANIMLTGGVESVIEPLAVAGFNALKALSIRNDAPTRASRPFDRDRDGFVMGEGCGMLLLEKLEHARIRGAKIYAEIVGFGASGDAYHMTAPPEDGRGMALAMQAALREAEIIPEAVEHINAHGTSTELNDVCETRAIKTVFGNHAKNLAITGNKSMIGHLLGGSGGVESVFAVLTLHHGILPGTINLENPDKNCDLDYLADGSRIRQVEYVLNNSFGFGGTNACLLFKRWDG